MKRNLSAVFGTHPFLVLVFPLVFLIATNRGQEVEFTRLLPYFAILGVLAALLWLVLLGVYRRAAKASLATSAFLFLGFLYHNLFNKLMDVTLFREQRVLFESVTIGLFVFSVGSVLIVLHRATKVENARNFAFLAACLLIGINAIRVGGSWINELKTREPGNRNSQTRVRTDGHDQVRRSGSGALLPDIYYIIPDGMGCRDTIQRFYDVDVQPIYLALESRGFRINHAARANYATTFLSLDSTLNMRYVHDELRQFATDRSRSIPYRQIDENAVVDFLRGKGYLFVHFSSGWGATLRNENADIEVYTRDVSQADTLGYSALPLYAWIRPHFGSAQTERKTPVSLDPERVTQVLKELPTVTDGVDQPCFVMAHVVSPHPPFIFHADGSLRQEKSEASYNVGTWFKGIHRGYEEQVLFFFRAVNTVVDRIISKPDRKAIIIIQSDHGPSVHSQEDDEWILHRMHIFSAMYFPSEITPTGAMPISAANTFPYALSGVFAEMKQRELLPYEARYSSYGDPYAFRDVTQLVEGWSF